VEDLITLRCLFAGDCSKMTIIHTVQRLMAYMSIQRVELRLTRCCSQASHRLYSHLAYW